MLTIKNLYVSVEGKEVVRGVSLTVQPGEVHAIMGPNGSGKSSLAMALMGHPNYKVKNQNSKVKVDGKDVLSLTPDQRSKAGLFLAFQYPVAVAGVTVEQFLREVAREKSESALDFRKRIFVQAKALGIKEELLKRSLNDGFSGGEKKRVEILQMAILKPKYAVLDETDSGLDIDALKSVASGVRRVVSEQKTGVIVITHYQRILRYLRPNFIHVMVAGKIVKSGGGELAVELEKKGYGAYQ